MTKSGDKVIVMLIVVMLVVMLMLVVLVVTPVQFVVLEDGAQYTNHGEPATMRSPAPSLSIVFLLLSFSFTLSSPSPCLLVVPHVHLEVGPRRHLGGRRPRHRGPGAHLRLQVLLLLPQHHPYYLAQRVWSEPRLPLAEATLRVPLSKVGGGW